MPILADGAKYDAVPVRLTALLLEHVADPNSINWSNEGDRIQKVMDAGDQFRTNIERPDAMALLAVLGIQAERDKRDPAKSYAYVIRQLKHPEEVSTLRQIYGDRLFVIGLYSTYAERLRRGSLRPPSLAYRRRLRASILK